MEEITTIEGPIFASAHQLIELAPTERDNLAAFFEVSHANQESRTAQRISYSQELAELHRPLMEPLYSGLTGTPSASDTEAIKRKLDLMRKMNQPDEGPPSEEHVPEQDLPRRQPPPGFGVLRQELPEKQNVISMVMERGPYLNPGPKSKPNDSGAAWATPLSKASQEAGELGGHLRTVLPGGKASIVSTVGFIVQAASKAKAIQFSLNCMGSSYRCAVGVLGYAHSGTNMRFGITNLTTNTPIVEHITKIPWAIGAAVFGTGGTRQITRTYSDGTSVTPGDKYFVFLEVETFVACGGIGVGADNDTNIRVISIQAIQTG